MTRDDIIRMAREAYGDWYPNAVPHELERFASLIADAEREACATIIQRAGLPSIAAAIRARGAE